MSKLTRHTSLYLYISVALIGAALLYLRVLSADFYLGTTTVDHPYIQVVISLMIAGAVWMFLPSLIRRTPNDRAAYWGFFFIVSGLVFRAIFIGSTPVYEDDFNRYLWDGYQVSHGVNPYAQSPKEILDELSETTATPDNLSDAETTILNRVNYPHLTTIYPPVAQSVFALAAMAKPLSLDALRLIYLVVEAITLFLIVKTLQAFNRAASWVGLYALCPLVIFAGFNTAHMDVLLPPFLIAALLFIRRHPYAAALSLVGAIGVKLWPLILAPIYFRSWLRRPKTLAVCIAIVTTGSVIMAWPMLLALGSDSGLQAYSSSWQRSSFLFPNIDALLGSNGARIFIAVLLGAGSLFIGLKGGSKTEPGQDDRLPFVLSGFILAFLFLSPTGYPWYVIWVLPFLPFAPLYGLMVLSLTVSLYYVRFALGEQGVYWIYTDMLVPIQFGLPIAILLFEWIRIRKKWTR